MKKFNLLLLSTLFGLVISLIITALILLISSFYIGNLELTSTAIWLYVILAIPITLCFDILCEYFSKHKQISNKILWKITIISVVSISLFSGVIGTIVSDVLIYGNTDINFKGRIIWGIIYAIGSLPITLILGKLIINIYSEFIYKITK